MAERRNLYAFDSSVLLLLAGAAPREADEPERFRQFIENHRATSRLAVPTAVLAECPGLLIPNGFESLDLTAEAAYLAQKFVPIIKGKKQAERRCLKLDALIFATAAVHGANTLFTSDDGDFQRMVRMSDRRMSVDRLPPLQAWQPDLPELEP